MNHVLVVIFLLNHILFVLSKTSINHSKLERSDGNHDHVNDKSTLLSVPIVKSFQTKSHEATVTQLIFHISQYSGWKALII